MHPFHVLLLVFALFSLVAFAFMIRWERSQFIERGKGHCWRRVRISSIPIAIFAVAIAVVPTKAVSGMEGLAVFYGLLFTVVPIFWFGAHWLVGKSVSPPLSFGESAAIAGSPILFGLAAAYTAHALQTPAWLFIKYLGLL
ncbi:MAG: hypothetical protein PHR94_08505 [Methylomonas lenta]|nr:hypothetical protein [Methylomonas lenta]